VISRTRGRRPPSPAPEPATGNGPDRAFPGRCCRRGETLLGPRLVMDTGCWVQRPVPGSVVRWRVCR
jgi:hypothetical protein